MGLTPKDMISSLSKLLDWLEQESNWGTNNGEFRFITGRIGEIYTAIMTNGSMAIETNQNLKNTRRLENDLIKQISLKDEVAN